MRHFDSRRDSFLATVLCFTAWWKVFVKIGAVCHTRMFWSVSSASLQCTFAIVHFDRKEVAHIRIAQVNQSVDAIMTMTPPFEISQMSADVQVSEDKATYTREL